MSKTCKMHLHKKLEANVNLPHYFATNGILMSMISIDQGVDMGSYFNVQKQVQGSKKLQLTTIISN